jgi:transcription elongation factor GreB
LDVSKAFTHESDEVTADEIAPVRPHWSAGAKNYITREGADRLRQRLTVLLAEKRVLAGEGGELNPNAKAALSRLESAIQKLQATLDSIIVAEPPTDQTKIAFGASVRVRDEAGEEETYQIVGIDEADPGQGRISSASPLARAILTRQAGQKVRFQSPAGERELTILSVHY